MGKRQIWSFAGFAFSLLTSLKKLVPGEFQNNRIPVATARMFKVHKVGLYTDDAPIFLQFSQNAWDGSTEVDQKLIGTVVKAR